MGRRGRGRAAGGLEIGGLDWASEGCDWLIIVMDVGGGQWEFELFWSRTPLFVNRMLVAFLKSHCIGWTCAASQRENVTPVSRELRAQDHCWKHKKFDHYCCSHVPTAAGAAWKAGGGSHLAPYASEFYRLKLWKFWSSVPRQSKIYTTNATLTNTSAALIWRSVNSRLTQVTKWQHSHTRCG